jgi:hypothetical protein
MKDNTFYNTIIAISIIGIIIILFFSFSNNSNDNYTELYFNNIEELDSYTSLNEENKISFTIHNSEGETIYYEYSIYIDFFNDQGDIKKTMSLDQGSISLKNNESAIIYTEYTIFDNYPMIKINIESNGENINFLQVIE